MKKFDHMLSHITYEDPPLILSELDGKQTISSSKEVFAYIDPEFRKVDLSISSYATKECIVDIHKIEPGFPWKFTLREIFSEFTGNYRDVCLTQHQVLGFIKTEPLLCLPEGGCGMFFPVKTKKDYFVVWIGFIFDKGGYDLPCAVFYSFRNDKLWDSEEPRRLGVLRT